MKFLGNAALGSSSAEVLEDVGELFPEVEGFLSRQMVNFELVGINGRQRNLGIPGES